jgi:peptidoglycan/xylan/chitin deacetylase (PgdA/CDA1 family)
MTQLSHDAWTNRADWSDLSRELDHWGEAGRAATLWWRDDDATAPNGRLDRLLALAGDVPVALAVIPAMAEPELASWLAQRAPGADVAQHGWRHANHARDRKKSEFPAARPAAAVEMELAAGHARLKALFGDRALAVLVPPWNRLDARFLPLLAGCGITALSCSGPRRALCAAPGISAANVHIDLVAWREDRGFIGAAAALGGIVTHLRARRLSLVDAAEPTGILTHHAIEDAGAEAFLRTLLVRTRRHGAVRWLAAREVFARS